MEDKQKERGKLIKIEKGMRKEAKLRKKEL